LLCVFQCNNLPFVVDNSLNPSAHNAFSDLRKEFVDLRKKGQLCDAVIKVDGREFPIHRAIMSGCSPYFRGLFTDSLNHTEVTKGVEKWGQWSIGKIKLPS
jgi:hypothetical protein